MRIFRMRNCMNLLALWHCYGASKKSGLWFSKGWPYRVWHDSLESKQTLLYQQQCQLSSNQQLAMITPSAAEPEMHRKGFHVEVRLTLMHLLITEARQPLGDDSDFELLDSDDDLGINAFMQICSEGFGYPMEVTSLRNAAQEKNVKLGFLRVSGERVATVLLYQQGKVMGVYQVAVPPDLRGKGYAREVMLHSIQWAQEQGAELMTLQASDMGLNLYRRLGFQEDGEITFWRKQCTAFL